LLKESELKRINVMLDKALLEEVDKFAKVKKEDRSTAIRQLLLEKLIEKRIELAVDQFVSGQSTFRNAASLAGMDYWDFQYELEKREIPIMRDLSLAEKRINYILKNKS